MCAVMGPEIKVISQVADFSFEELWYELADEDHFWMQWRLAAFKNQMRRLRIPLDAAMRRPRSVAVGGLDPPVGTNDAMDRGPH